MYNTLGSTSAPTICGGPWIPRRSRGLPSAGRHPQRASLLSDGQDLDRRSRRGDLRLWWAADAAVWPRALPLTGPPRRSPPPSVHRTTSAPHDSLRLGPGPRRSTSWSTPDGTTYVMQSYSLVVDPRLTRSRLAQLGGRLQLPDGWRYRVRRLEEEWTLGVDGEAACRSRMSWRTRTSGWNPRHRGTTSREGDSQRIYLRSRPPSTLCLAKAAPTQADDRKSIVSARRPVSELAV